MTISDLETLRSSTSRPTGTIIAPPRPWNMRAPISVGSETDAPHRIEPSVNTTIAEQNTVRAPSLSATQPEAGMNTASVSM